MDQEFKKIVIRNGTEAEWLSDNPVLLLGEFGVTMDTIPKKIKIGDGVTMWSGLEYNISEVTIADIDGLQDILDNKSGINHNHTLSSLSEKSYDSLTEKPNIPSLPIAISDVTNLQTELNGKEPANANIQSHIADSNIHVTSTEKTTWNAKADQSDTYTKTEIDAKIGDIETLLGAI